MRAHSGVGLLQLRAVTLGFFPTRPWIGHALPAILSQEQDFRISKNLPGGTRYMCKVSRGLDPVGKTELKGQKTRLG